MAALIQAQDVTKQFGDTTAVNALSLAVDEGELVALLGPNGAGKTTLIRMLVGIIKPDRGRIARAFDDAAGRPRGVFGYLPEERGLYQDMPIQATLQFFGVLQGMSPKQAAQSASMWLERLGLEARGSEKVKSLSKGNQQKVQFAAAILHKPRLAILDEPFSGLDPVNQDVFLQLIRELRAGGTTVIFSAHQMPLVERLADRVCLMSRGRMVLQGSIAELRQRWHTGDRLIIGTNTACDVSVFDGLTAVDSVDRINENELQLRLASGANVSQVLRLVADQMDVKYLRSEATTLHEIYVRTIEADTAAVSNTEVPS